MRFALPDALRPLGYTASPSFETKPRARVMTNRIRGSNGPATPHWLRPRPSADLTSSFLAICQVSRTLNIRNRPAIMVHMEKGPKQRCPSAEQPSLAVQREKTRVSALRPNRMFFCNRSRNVGPRFASKGSDPFSATKCVRVKKRFLRRKLRQTPAA